MIIEDSTAKASEVGFSRDTTFGKDVNGADGI